MNLRSERGDWQFGPIAGLIIVILAVIGFFAVCTGDDDKSNSLGTIQLVSHERSRCYEDEGCYEDDRGDYSGDQDYDQWNNDQRNHNRRNRGAFSPGPFTDSPVTIIVCPPGTQYCGSDGSRDQPPPDKGEPSE
jgi:hypothetical protein